MKHNIREQLEIERTVKYDDVENTLLPSLRRSYVPDKYYNATSFSEYRHLANIKPE